MSSSRANKELRTGNRKMKRPERGGKPKKIETENPPGGPKTPGEKGTYKPKG